MLQVHEEDAAQGGARRRRRAQAKQWYLGEGLGGWRERPARTRRRRRVAIAGRSLADHLEQTEAGVKRMAVAGRPTLVRSLINLRGTEGRWVLRSRET